MDTPHNHKFDGKEDRNYHQKPFDDNTDPLPQIDKASADLQVSKKSEQYGNPDTKKNDTVPAEALPDDTFSDFAQDDEALSDEARISHYKAKKD